MNGYTLPLTLMAAHKIPAIYELLCKRSPPASAPAVEHLKTGERLYSFQLMYIAGELNPLIPSPKRFAGESTVDAFYILRDSPAYNKGSLDGVYHILIQFIVVSGILASLLING